jgi:hypothetical protein
MRKHFKNGALFHLIGRAEMIHTKKGDHSRQNLVFAIFTHHVLLDLDPSV